MTGGVCDRLGLRRESSLLARGRLMVSKAKRTDSGSLPMDEVDGDSTPAVTTDSWPKLDLSHVGQCRNMECVCVCVFVSVCV